MSSVQILIIRIKSSIHNSLISIFIYLHTNAVKPVTKLREADNSDFINKLDFKSALEKNETIREL